MNQPSWLPLRWGNKLPIEVNSSMQTNINRCRFFLLCTLKLLSPATVRHFSYVNPAIYPKQSLSPSSTISVSKLTKLEVPESLFHFCSGPVMVSSHVLLSSTYSIFAASPPEVRYCPFHGYIVMYSASTYLPIPLQTGLTMFGFWWEYTEREGSLGGWPQHRNGILFLLLRLYLLLNMQVKINSTIKLLLLP